MVKNASTFLQAALILTLLPELAQAQLSEDCGLDCQRSNQYRVVPGVTYLTANNWEAKLDVYAARNPARPSPTLIYIHGGGWVGGSKEGSLLNLLPYLEMGWAAVNVEYRLARVSQAPAAVEDCLCALRWVIRNAKEYNFDTSKLVVTGHSAGGHLSLTTGMIPASAGLDRQCPGNEDLKVAAIINWYGITDVGDLFEGANRQSYAVTWLGSMLNRNEIAARVSPLDLCAFWFASHSDDPWRRGSHGPLFARRSASRRFGKGRRAQSTCDYSGWKTRRILSSRNPEDFRHDSRVPGQTQPGKGRIKPVGFDCGLVEDLPQLLRVLGDFAVTVGNKSNREGAKPL